MRINLNDYKVGSTFETTCAKVKRITSEKNTDEYIYNSFGIDPDHAAYWGHKKEDIINVRCTIIEEDIIMEKLYKKDSGYDDNQVDYFGWVEFEGKMNISMIYPNIKMYFICFPYGPDCLRFWDNDVINIMTKEIEHNKGDRRGMTVRLKIEEI